MIYLLFVLLVIAVIWVIIESTPHPVRGYNLSELLLAIFVLFVLIVTFVILYAKNGNNLF